MESKAPIRSFSLVSVRYGPVIHSQGTPFQASISHKPRYLPSWVFPATSNIHTIPLDGHKSSMAFQALLLLLDAQNSHATTFPFRVKRLVGSCKTGVCFQTAVTVMASNQHRSRTGEASQGADLFQSPISFLDVDQTVENSGVFCGQPPENGEIVGDEHDVQLGAFLFYLSLTVWLLFGETWRCCLADWRLERYPQSRRRERISSRASRGLVSRQRDETSGDPSRCKSPAPGSVARPLKIHVMSITNIPRTFHGPSSVFIQDSQVDSY